MLHQPLGISSATIFPVDIAMRFEIENMVVGGLFISWTVICLALLPILFGFGSVALFLIIISVSGVGKGITMPSVTAGMMSVRPYLAETASGLGRSFLIPIGGGLSLFASLFMGGQTLEVPIAMVMRRSTAIGLICSFYVLYLKCRAIR